MTSTHHEDSFIELKDKNDGSVLHEESNAKIYKWYHVNTSTILHKLTYFSENARNLAFNPTLVLFLTGIGLNKTESGVIMGLR